MNETNALQKIEPAGESFGAMVQRAIDKGVPVETMERLLAMYEKLQAKQAKAEFDSALAAFQAECPTIQKTKKVMNKDGRSVRYQYAPLEVIVQQVKGLLEKHGFSYTVDAEVEPGLVRATCKATHHLGHSQTSSFSVPIDKDAYMNPAQQCASALTFAKRYAFCNAFGILTGDEDDDSQASHEPKKGDNAKGSQGQERPRTSDNAVRGKKGEILTRPPVATEDQRVRWVKQLKAIEDKAVAYGYAEGILLPPGDNFPGEPIECWPLNATPSTKWHAEKLFAKIQAFEPRKPAGAPAPPSTSTPPAQSAGNQAKQAPTVAQSASRDSQDGPEAQPWFNAVVPVPYAGMKRDEYLKKPDTIGELYNARHDDEQARRRLFGFLHNFEPKGWTGRDGKPRPPSDSDKKFRDDLDAFGEWFEENHPDEAEND